MRDHKAFLSRPLSGYCARCFGTLKFFLLLFKCLAAYLTTFSSRLNHIQVINFFYLNVPSYLLQYLCPNICTSLPQYLCPKIPASLPLYMTMYLCPKIPASLPPHPCLAVAKHNKIVVIDLRLPVKIPCYMYNL